ncbi:MAG: DUF4176 domain-containing protein [Aeromicrobium sp.]|uniref:DUF4176 domain-containing protein n=1 Tax=Aeromicrobium sp. TaxID=1871063 RepID=UPI0039E3E207
MTEQQPETRQQENKKFLPLGSIVILKGSVKKLLIVSRGSIVEGRFFDYGAFLYPEGMVDTNIAYFNHDDILKIVHEGYRDTDDELVLEILDNAYAEFQKEQQEATPAPTPVTAAPVATEAVDDPFASVRDLDDE